MIIAKKQKIKQFYNAKKIMIKSEFLLIFMQLIQLIKKKIPIYLADYVLNDYATGIVMGVASADKRDYEFAQKHKLEVIPIIKSNKQCFTIDGIHINSGRANGLNIE